MRDGGWRRHFPSDERSGTSYGEAVDHIESMGHPTTTLEDLFMRIVRENTDPATGKSIAYTGSNEVG